MSLTMELPLDTLVLASLDPPFDFRGANRCSKKGANDSLELSCAGERRVSRGSEDTAKRLRVRTGSDAQAQAADPFASRFAEGAARVGGAVRRLVAVVV